MRGVQDGSQTWYVSSVWVAAAYRSEQPVIGAPSSAMMTVPSSVVEDEPIEIVGSEMAPARQGSYGDCD